MVVVSYDISDDKLRATFSKFLGKFGYRLQYSVFKIENSRHILNNIVQEIENKFSKKFDEKDSVIIFKLSSNCEIIKYGYAKHEDESAIIIG